MSARIVAWAAWVVLVACDGKTLRLGTVAPSLQDGATAGSGMGGSGGAAVRDGASDGRVCQRAQVKAAEVVWIGDSWITQTGTQHTRVRDLARAAGALGSSADYTLAAVDGAVLSAVVNQYTTAEARPIKVKVLLMDGGTLDTIISPIDAQITKVVEAFQQFLAQVASDGTVQQIVYFLQPELQGIPGVAALRPGLTQACAASTVPCHFLDLQPLWIGHLEFTASNGIWPSEAGASVIADSVWKIMQDNCIAQ